MRRRKETESEAYGSGGAICGGFAPVGTFRLLSPKSSAPVGDGAGAIGGRGARATNADVRAASTAKKTVEPRNEEYTSTTTRSHGPSSPPAGAGAGTGTGLCLRRTISDAGRWPHVTCKT
uniref:Uncharacterized protein n=1 Tax=Oryza brachyantha TaxID=4533 RepID=J3LM71_ORYBR